MQIKKVHIADWLKPTVSVYKEKFLERKAGNLFSKSDSWFYISGQKHCTYEQIFLMEKQNNNNQRHYQNGVIRTEIQ